MNKNIRINMVLICINELYIKLIKYLDIICEYDLHFYQATFISIVLQIVSKQLHSENQENSRMNYGNSTIKNVLPYRGIYRKILR